jgi:hypothetical protein
MDCVNGFLNGFRFKAEGDIVGDDVMGTNMDGACVSGEILEGQGCKIFYNSIFYGSQNQ